MGFERRGLHARVVPRGRLAHLEAAVVRQDIVEELADALVVVDHEHPPLLTLERVERDPVVPHEAHELLARDPPELAARDTKPMQAAVVEAADDRLLADLADLRGLPGREDLLVLPSFDGALARHGDPRY
eukprot:TRINITY_DN44864_c1_g1_i2.p3 TRINITY_DN44864_c1_g1~~TRINITY_DN44864_c1_g1_i2.p3  ORF type:complete len:130 (-),score=20.98 TRINITY_DN44864_c1_g1_i2:71-460(-)